MTHRLTVLPDQNYPAPHRTATRELLLEAVTGAQNVKQPRRLARRAIVVGVAAAVLLAGTGAAAAYHFLGSAPVTDTHSARCYTKASTDFGPHFPGTSVIDVGESAPGQPTLSGVVAPIRLCTYLWSIGKVSDQTDHTPPPMTGCVLPNGTAAVFPGPPGTCGRLGLPDAAPG